MTVLNVKLQSVAIGGVVIVVMVSAVLFLVAYQPWPQASWLHTSGTGIYDEQNRRVRLFGPNVSVSGDGNGLGLADVQRIKALGFNTLRVPVPWRLLQPYNESLEGIDQPYFTRAQLPLYHGLDEIVSWAIQEKMYLIICLYWSQSEPPPAWAFPGTSDDSQRYIALINGTASRERLGLANTWKYIASRYKDAPNILFELFNEPFVPESYSSLAGDSYKSFNEAIISAIESVETKPHIKIVELLLETPVWEEIVDGAMDIDRANVVWAFHYYAPMNNWDPKSQYWHGAFTWRGQYFKEGSGNGTLYVTWRITRVGDKIHAWDKPLMVTEFAKDTTQQYWREWYLLVLSTISGYTPVGLIIHEYANNPQFEAGWNINNPTTKEKLMTVRFW